MSSRLLLAAMNSSRLTSLPMPDGIPSKSSLLEFRYIFFSLVSLQMADWGRRRWYGEGEPRPWRHGKGCHGWAGTYGQGGELIAGQVEGLQLGPLVDAEGQLCDLVAAEVEAPQAAQGVEALGDATEVVAGQVHVWGRIRGRHGWLDPRQGQENPWRAPWGWVPQPYLPGSLGPPGWWAGCSGCAGCS